MKQRDHCYTIIYARYNWIANIHVHAHWQSQHKRCPDDSWSYARKQLLRHLLVPALERFNTLICSSLFTFRHWLLYVMVAVLHSRSPLVITPLCHSHTTRHACVRGYECAPSLRAEPLPGRLCIQFVSTCSKTHLKSSRFLHSLCHEQTT